MIANILKLVNWFELNWIFTYELHIVVNYLIVQIRILIHASRRVYISVIYVYTLYTSRSEHEQNETKIQMDLENSNF